MKFSVDAKALAAALTMTSRVVERRSTYPILMNVMITADATGLTLCSSDLDLEIRTTIDADVETEGSTTIPARTASEIVRKLADGTITFEAGEEHATVKCGRSRFQLSCLSPDGFPTFPVNDLSWTYVFQGRSLADILGKVSYAISSEETRYYLNGVFVHSPTGADIRFVATDGHRLARFIYDAERANELRGIIIPRKTAAEIQKLAGGADQVTLEVGETRIRCTVGNVVLNSKLIEGNFPDYESVIPKGYNLKARMVREDVEKIVDRASVVASDRGGRAAKLDLTPGNLKVSVNNTDMGSAEESMDIDYDGMDVDIGFNARYLLDTLSNFSATEVDLHLQDGGSPAVVTADANPELLCVIMPMRV